MDVFWQARNDGASYVVASARAGFNDSTGRNELLARGGIRPRPRREPSGRFLSLAEREEIALAVVQGFSPAAIGRQLGRHRSTIIREIARNGVARAHARPPWRPGDPGMRGRPRVYRAIRAQGHADRRRARPKPAKLVVNAELRAIVTERLTRHWSPRQISATLKVEFGDRVEMQVSHETIYQSLYVQSRGALRRELTACLRTGRAIRRPQRRADERRGRIPNMLMISERPPEVADRAVPGHWEGDLIIGKDSNSAIGTLVERALALRDPAAPTRPPHR